jgi:Protein of unknown function (DUF5661)
MHPKRKFAIEEAGKMGGQLGVNQSVVDFAEFRRELKTELEHGLSVPEANSNAPLTGKIARAHLKEFPDSSTRWTDSKPKRISSRQRKG